MITLRLLSAAGFALLAGPALASPAITVAAAGFAVGPGTDYDIHGTLPVGTHLDVVWCGTHENWCLVELHNQMGWVPLDVLNLKPGGSSVALNGGTGGGAGGPAAVATDPGPGPGESAVLSTDPPPGHTPISSIHLPGPITIIGH